MESKTIFTPKNTRAITGNIAHLPTSLVVIVFSDLPRRTARTLKTADERRPRQSEVNGRRIRSRNAHVVLTTRRACDETAPAACPSCGHNTHADADRAFRIHRRACGGYVPASVSKRAISSASPCARTYKRRKSVHAASVVTVIDTVRPLVDTI